MASEAILKNLFELAKSSTVFQGMSDDDIWKACLKYKDRPDDDIEVAMENIRSKDREATQQAELQREKMEENKEKMEAMHQQEASDRLEDAKNADKILEEFF
jgi:hypothetical protein